MKVILDVKGEPKNGDILIFKDGYLEYIDSNKFLKDLYILKEEIKCLENIKKDIKLLKGED